MSIIISVHARQIFDSEEIPLSKLMSLQKMEF